MTQKRRFSFENLLFFVFRQKKFCFTLFFRQAFLQLLDILSAKKLERSFFMREFYIYLITKEVAHSYYGKENKLFQLFYEEQRSSGIPKQILAKQISYITASISVSQLEEHFWQQLREKYNWRFESESYTLQCRKSTVRLELNDSYLHLYSIGNFEAETIMFEALRQFEPYFLAMDYGERKYGWLSPFKLNMVYAT
jgi:Sporulation inhibitor of replication protein SirA